MTGPSPLTETRLLRAGRWTAAAMLIAALHVSGAALALMTSNDETPFEEPQGAIMVDFAPVAQAPVSHASDAPPGPEAEESAAVPVPVLAAHQEVAKVETPELAPAPLAPDPEVVLPKRAVTELESEEMLEEMTASDPQLVAPSDAVPETTSSPKIDGVVAREAAAPQVGMTDAEKKAQLSWQGSLRSHLEGHKRYPGEARAQGIQGIASVEFTIDRGGYVIGARIARSSGSSLLDAEALATIKRASPLPEPPRHLPEATFAFVIPVQFTMR